MTYLYLKKELIELLNRHFYIIPKKGILKGVKLYGDVFFNRRKILYTSEEFFYKKYDFKNKIVFDVGANIGLTTLYFSSFQATKVFSFEPNPYVFKTLTKNIKRNKRTNVSLFNFGISDCNKTLKFISNKYVHSTGTFDMDRHDEIRAKSKYYYELYSCTKSIDEFCMIHNIEFIDFLKIDTEGFEMNVLNGAKKMIRQSKPDIYFEIHGSNYATKERNLTNICEFLNNIGYSIKCINNNENVLPSRIIYFISKSYDNFFASIAKG